MTVTILPDADSVEGLLHDPNKKDPDHGIVRVQYRSSKANEVFQVSMTAVNALYLLNELRRFEADDGFLQRNRPDHDQIRGRLTRVGFETTANVPERERSFQLEVADQTAPRPWHVILPMADAPYLAGELNAQLKRISRDASK